MGHICQQLEMQLENDDVINIKEDQDPTGLAVEYLNDILAEIFEEILKLDTGDFQAWIEDLKPTLYLNLTTFIDELAKAFTNGLEGLWEYFRVNLRKRSLSKLTA